MALCLEKKDSCLSMSLYFSDRNTKTHGRADPWPQRSTDSPPLQNPHIYHTEYHNPLKSLLTERWLQAQQPAHTQHQLPMVKPKATAKILEIRFMFIISLSPYLRSFRLYLLRRKSRCWKAAHQAHFRSSVMGHTHVFTAWMTCTSAWENWNCYRSGHIQCMLI